MTKITRFEDLECWQQARTLVKEVYGVTKGREFKKDFRLSGQIQAAATSSMANIAEGFIRRSNKEFVQSNKTAKIIFGLIKYLRTKQTRQTKQTRLFYLTKQVVQYKNAVQN